MTPRRFLKAATSMAILFIGIILYQNCSQGYKSIDPASTLSSAFQGTDTGNVNERFIGSDAVVFAMCARANHCASHVDVDPCKENLFADLQLPSLLGILRPISLKEMREEELVGTTKADLNAALACLEIISAGSCDALTSDMSANEIYSSTLGWIQGQCSAVFR